MLGYSRCTAQRHVAPAGQPFRQAEAAGLRFPQAQKVAEPGLLHPGPVLHLLGTGAFAQGKEEEEEEEVIAS